MPKPCLFKISIQSHIEFYLIKNLAQVAYNILHSVNLMPIPCLFENVNVSLKKLLQQSIHCKLKKTFAVQPNFRYTLSKNVG